MLKNSRKINSFRLEFAVAILNSLKVNKVSSFLNMAAIPVNNLSYRFAIFVVFSGIIEMVEIIQKYML